MLATYRKYEQEADRLSASKTEAEDSLSSSKRRRAREARKMATKLKAALDQGRIEEDIKGVKMEKVTSEGSTKQAMIARVRL